MNKQKIILNIAILMIVIVNINAVFALVAKEDTKKVEIDNNIYIPDNITVTGGTTVNWINNDVVAHTVTDDTDIFNSGIISPGDGFNYTFDNIGVFRYHCEIHSSMHGVVNVISSNITVVSPNGGEKWARDTIHTIKWNNTGDQGIYVKIELLKGGMLDNVINYSTHNNGSFDWEIPPSQATGSDYKIRIRNESNPAYNDTSDNNFTISSSIKGDINDDGIITSSDALLYLRYAVGQNISPYNIDMNDDVTCDGQITASDALKVLRKAIDQNVVLEC